ncbi:MAG TPA: hypothetical protein VFI20_06330 [Terracidiphilus sp.]|nr:hypothetical protein [Terracidiphilus sp.]
MKNLVFATVMALATAGLVVAPSARAQDQITIKDPAEFNAYQMATTQTEPKAKAAALENFLKTYPDSVVKKAVLDSLMDSYQQLGEADQVLSAASRLLEADPGNMKAITMSVYIKKAQCSKTKDAQTCGDAAALAKKGLAVPKPTDLSDDDWKKQTGAVYPIFHSAVALDAILIQKDAKTGIDEYTTELMLYPAEATKSGPALLDTLQLAQAYTLPGATKDLVKAIWFYARAWNFFPAAYKPQVEKSLEYYYTQFHGNLKGLDDVKSQAAATVFPPGTFQVKAKATPAEIAHQVVTETADLTTLNLSDKEFILSAGATTDADAVWAVMKDKVTPVPGVVIAAEASVIKMAVSQDAKNNKVADFIVNLKKPLEDKDIPVAGTEFGLLPDANELDGTYDSYTQVPATATTTQRVEIVLRDGFIQEKKAAPVRRKPAAGHHRSGRTH